MAQQPVRLRSILYAQTIELGRANFARAPDSVMQKSLGEALNKLEAAVDVDAAGRIIYDTGAESTRR